MLVLSRRTSEEIVLPTMNTRIRILSVQGGRVRIGIEAPKEVAIRRTSEPATPKHRQVPAA